MATTRAKFSVQSINLVRSSYAVLDEEGKPVLDESGRYPTYETWAQPQVTLIAVNPSDNEATVENQRFWNASPSGTITIGISNHEAAGVFEVGKDYYVDFTPVAA